jgi:Fe/S biogenesis protein NfuA
MSKTNAILTATDSAVEALMEHTSTLDDDEHLARIAVSGRRNGSFQYDFEQIDSEDIQSEDSLVQLGKVSLYIEHRSVEQLKGAAIDYVVDASGHGGFHVENPNPLWTDDKSQKIQDVIDADINPAIASHGGAVELVKHAEPELFIKLVGGCQGCAMSTQTLKNGIEVLLKEAFPEFENIVDTTDHANGENPYFAG